MKKETLKEIGKGFINFGNGVGALSIVNGFFGNNTNLSPVITSFLIGYIVILFYIAGINLLNRSENV
jgi:hypothetical protein